MNINLTNQRTVIEQALPYFQSFQTEMDKRKAVWDRLTREKREAWIIAACGTKSSPKSLAESKDPVIWLANKLRQYLEGWEINDAN